GTIRTQHADLGARVEREVNTLENLSAGRNDLPEILHREDVLMFSHKPGNIGPAGVSWVGRPEPVDEPLSSRDPSDVRTDPVLSFLFLALTGGMLAPAAPAPRCAADGAGLKLPAGFCAVLVADSLGPV